MEEHGWFIKGLKDAADRVKDLPEWAKDNSSAIEHYYSDSSGDRERAKDKAKREEVAK